MELENLCSKSNRMEGENTKSGSVLEVFYTNNYSSSGKSINNVLQCHVVPLPFLRTKNEKHENEKTQVTKIVVLFLLKQ